MILKTANIWLFFYAANLKQILFKNIFGKRPLNTPSEFSL